MTPPWANAHRARAGLVAGDPEEGAAVRGLRAGGDDGRLQRRLVVEVPYSEGRGCPAAAW
jgi:hypothetical protein